MDLIDARGLFRRTFPALTQGIEEMKGVRHTGISWLMRKKLKQILLWSVSLMVTAIIIFQSALWLHGAWQVQRFRILVRSTDIWDQAMALNLAHESKAVQHDLARNSDYYDGLIRHDNAVRKSALQSVRHDFMYKRETITKPDGTKDEKTSYAERVN